MCGVYELQRLLLIGQQGKRLTQRLANQDQNNSTIIDRDEFLDE